MPKRYPSEFRRKVLDLVTSGRRVAQVAADLDISEQTIYTWRRQELIYTGQLPGTTSTDNAAWGRPSWPPGTARSGSGARYGRSSRTPASSGVGFMEAVKDQGVAF